MTLQERLRDLHKQATSERSHYYVGSTVLEAADRIDAKDARIKELEGALRDVLQGFDGFAAELAAVYTGTPHDYSRSTGFDDALARAREVLK